MKIIITESQFNKLVESNLDVIYTAIFFNTNELINEFKPVYKNIFAHHSTIEFKPKDISNLPIGKTVRTKIIGRLITDKVDVLLIDNEYSTNKYPHITLSTNDGVKPYQSNSEIENNLDKIKPINKEIVGKVGYFNGKQDVTTQMTEQLNEADIQPLNIPNTTTYWHGGNLDNYEEDSISQKSGRYEYGPGLYLITKYEEAVKYAKGNRKLYMVTVENGTDLEETGLDANNVKEFIKRFVTPAKRNEIWQRVSSRLNEDGTIPGYIFNNVLINENAIKPGNTKFLRQFYIDNGIDYNLVNNPFGWGETMMVLFNMKKIRNITKVGPKDNIVNYDLNESKNIQEGGLQMNQYLNTTQELGWMAEEDETAPVNAAEAFYAQNNINPDNLSYLGSGDFGEAYSTGDGRVVKTTGSKSEFEIAKQLENNPAPVLNAFAKIYKTATIGRDMVILMEELYEDSNIENLYYELEEYLSEQGLPIQYLGNLDTDEIELSDEMITFMDEIDDINRAYRYLGIEASDIKPDNMGRDKTGRLKAFDIEDKSRNR